MFAHLNLGKFFDFDILALVIRGSLKMIVIVKNDGHENETARAGRLREEMSAVNNARYVGRREQNRCFGA